MTTTFTAADFIAPAAVQLAKELRAGKPVATLAEELAADESSGDLDADEIARALWGLLESAIVESAREAGEQAAEAGEGEDEWPADGVVDVKAIVAAVGQHDVYGMPRRIESAACEAFRDAYASACA